MQTNPIPPFDHSDIRHGVYVADGHAIKVAVNRRHLIVSDGVGSHRREKRFHKATTDLRRLVVVGSTGYISLEALRWLADATIPLVHIDPEGRLLASSANAGSDRAVLRRAQAWAGTTELGVQIIRRLMTDKLRHQRSVALRLGGDVAMIDRSAEQIATAETPSDMFIFEAQAGNAYWSAWTGLPIPFTEKDRDSVAEHWLTFTTRRSPLVATGNRLAANPPNAILNYLYALLEAEARIAALTVGLDPGVGIHHADLKARDSLALDIMEPARPLVDGWVLDLLESHRFRADDFSETRRGVCRVTPPLTHRLAEATTHIATLVAPYAELVAQMLTETPDLRLDRIPTPLTGTNRRRAHTIYQPEPRSPRRAPKTVPSGCKRCGTKIPTKRVYCDPCAETHDQEKLQLMSQQSQKSLRKARSEGRDPAHGGTAASRRGETIRLQNHAAQDWDERNERPPVEQFTESILPTLANVTIPQMMEATGLSSGYCSMIKRGIKVPHPRHWPSLRRLGG